MPIEAMIGPAESSDEKADEGDGDDDRTRRDHRHGDGIEKLVIVQPAELLDHALLQERNDRQPAAENKSAGFGEE